jgi:lipopolysaccharide transport system permease protein
MTSTHPGADYEIVLESGRSARHYWADLWRYRELLYFLAWRDLLVRYKQTAIGVAWAVTRPVLTMLVFTFVFSKLAKLPSNGVPYPILVFAGLLPWQFFSTAFSGAGDSLVNNSSMISKVYFPRLIVPISSVVVSLADFAISMVILAAMMVWYGYWPGWQLLFLPLLTALAFTTSISAGVWIAALNVKYRDFKIIVPFIVQFGLYISPVGFISAVVPEQWRLLYSLNPMVGIIDAFRWSILGGATDVYWPALALSIGLTAVLLVTGIRYFRKTERTFADVI